MHPRPEDIDKLPPITKKVLRGFSLSKEIVKYPNPILFTQIPESVDFGKIPDTVGKMLNVIKKYPNCIGLAANQINISERVIIIAPKDSERIIIVNPKFTPLEDAQDISEEGCMSIPGLRGMVPRHTHILLEGFTPHGKSSKYELSGIGSVIAQHEIDHLDGICFFTKATNLEWV